ncbi:MAG: AraC family transcriptional regulator [Alphaproteobacteria bacterium]|nr:AraC family transcriptional regulator [Alphaproteobacteria bacterium]
MRTGLSVPVEVINRGLAKVRLAGGNPRIIMDALGLKPEVLADPNGHVAHYLYARFWEAAAVVTHDPFYGIHVGETHDMRTLGLVGYIFIASRTLGEALRNLLRFHRIHREGTIFDLTCHGDGGIEFEIRNLLDPPQDSRQYMEAVTAKAVSACRQIMGPQWSPITIHFGHARPPNTAEHERFFRCPICFSSNKNAVTLKKSDMELNNPLSDPVLLQILLNSAEVALASTEGPSSLTQSLQTFIATRLAGKPPTLRDAARELGMSSRTLQRRLAIQGRTYREVVQTVRRNLAINLMTATAYTLIDVAYMAGYSELSAFQTAFRRWTGETPRQYRENHAA